MSEDVSDEDRPQHRELCPLLLLNSVWVLLRPTELYRGLKELQAN